LQTAFSSVKFAPWQLSRPPLKGLWQFFRWKLYYLSTPSALQSWLGAFWLLTFRANEGSTGRITVPWTRGSSHWHSGMSEWNSDVWIETRLSPLEIAGSMGVGQRWKLLLWVNLMWSPFVPVRPRSACGYWLSIPLCPCSADRIRHPLGLSPDFFRRNVKVRLSEIQRLFTINSIHRHSPLTYIVQTISIPFI
jgi:hypothetical protein